MKGIYILPTNSTQKEYDEAADLVEDLGALLVTFADANIVITRIQATRRVQREVRNLIAAEAKGPRSLESHPQRAASSSSSSGGLGSRASALALPANGSPSKGKQRATEPIAQLLRPSSEIKEEMEQKLVAHFNWLAACKKSSHFLDIEKFRIPMPWLTKRQKEMGVKLPEPDKLGTAEASYSALIASTSASRPTTPPPKSKADLTQVVAESPQFTRNRLFLEPRRAEKDSAPKLDSPKKEESKSEEEELAPPSNTQEMRKASNEQIELSEPLPPCPNSTYACERPTPLKSRHNQDLVDELEIIKLQRTLTGDANHAMTYSRALSSVKSYQRPLTRRNHNDALKLKGVGKRIHAYIKDYYETGVMPEAEIIRADPAFETLRRFSQVYSVGPGKARDLYRMGYRTVSDLIRNNHWRPGKSAGTIDMQEALRIQPDLDVPIPRAEVEEIARVIKIEMDAVVTGTEFVITGGYRRGKKASNDVDIVYTNAKASSLLERGEIHALRDRLAKKGLLTHFIGSHNMTETGTTDDLQIIEIVCKLPASPMVPVSRHRRVDIIFAHPRIFGAAVLGWTGSTQFERDIRRWAKTKDLRFHSDGIRDTHTGELYPTYTEAEALAKLGLPYIPPEYRNCDA